MAKNASSTISYLNLATKQSPARVFGLCGSYSLITSYRFGMQYPDASGSQTCISNAIRRFGLTISYLHDFSFHLSCCQSDRSREYVRSNEEG
jgi:hypothetical protein